MKTLKKIIFVFLATLAMTSCKHKPENPSPTPVAVNSKVYRMSGNSDSFFKLFTYDNQNRISTIDLDQSMGHYYYDANNRVNKYVLTQDDGSPNLQWDIKYLSGSVVDHVLSYFPVMGNIPIDSASFEYQQNRISKIIHHSLDFQSQGYVESERVEFDYDSRGNVIKESHISGSGTETIEYTFDNNKTPWSLVIKSGWDPIFGVMSVNNITSQTYTDNAGLVNDSESYTAVYTYNSDSYPVTAEFTSLDGVKETYTIEYQ